MEEYQESDHNEHRSETQRGTSNGMLVIAVVALICLATVAFAYGIHQQSTVQRLTAQATTATASVTQLQDQVSSLTAKLNQMSTLQTQSQASPAPASASGSSAEPSTEVSAQSPETSGKTAAPGKTAHTTRRPTKRHAPVDKKYAQLQAQLAEQQKQLKETQDEVAKDRSELEGSLNSTRDDLNGSIARTHEELVALEKRGERSYFEFDLSKSKQFQRVGPLTLSLRKADTKHKSYDLSMFVDDNQLQKKKVNLYEPIWIHTENDSQPVQIVVNRIEKDHIHGYISAPKYKPSELATTGAASVTPVSAKTPADNPNPQPPNQPEQPQPFLQ